MEPNALERAIALACRAHAGQRYPTPEPEPYVFHLFRVMLSVTGEEEQTVAVLHDVIEDTEVRAGDLRAAGLSPEIVAAVEALTHRPEHTYEEYIEQLAVNPLATRVKLADLADNLANNRGLEPVPEVLERIERYERAQRRLGKART